MSLFDDPATEDRPIALGRAMIGGHGGPNKRQDHDYYPTPAEVTRAFLRYEGRYLRVDPCPIWEPCGRGGAIMRELEAEGFETIGTDLVPDLANRVEPLDILRATKPRSRRVITNPPFNIAAEIITHLLGRLDVEYLALLLKTSYWHAEERSSLFERHRPARIYALNWRPDFLGQGAPTMDCIWTVWQRGRKTTRYHVLRRRPDIQGVLL